MQSTPIQSAIVQPPFSLDDAIAYAQQHDPWLQGNVHQQQALEATSIAVGELPDPQASLGFANFPLDTFDFGQEPMTQFKFGITQVFPRGNTRRLQQQQMVQMSARYPFMREDRRQKVAVTVAHLWLECYRHHETIRLIKKDRALFEHLVDVAQSSYTTALGQTRQKDLVRAQLELTRLEDRLASLQQQQDRMQARLGEWLSDGKDFAATTTLSDALPQLTLRTTLSTHDLGSDGELISTARLSSYLLKHPVMVGIEHKMIASNTAVALERQKYKPQWGLEASYGYRGDDRADLVSLGVTFDVPLFTAKRQDKSVQSAVSKAEAVKAEKVLMLRSLRSGFAAAYAELHWLNQRKTLYEDRLLEETHEQAEAALTAYTNDAGDFSEVVQARIAELNASIDLLNIDIDRIKTIAQLNYFFATSPRLHQGANRAGETYE